MNLRREEMRLAAETGEAQDIEATFPGMDEPTPESREEHELRQHYPAKAWCEHCHLARMKDRAHMRLDATQARLPVIGTDLRFIEGESGADGGHGSRGFALGSRHARLAAEQERERG